MNLRLAGVPSDFAYIYCAFCSPYCFKGTNINPTTILHDQETRDLSFGVGPITRCWLKIMQEAIMVQFNALLAQNISNQKMKENMTIIICSFKSQEDKGPTCMKCIII